MGRQFPASSPFGTVLTASLPHEEECDGVLRRFWEQEEIVETPALRAEDQECERLYMERCTRRADGRYVVRLPLRPGVVEGLGKTIRTVTKLMELMQARLDHDATLKKEYTDFLHEYEREGHMRCVAHLEQPTHPTSLYYLPHHGVYGT